jgi:DNA-binding NarL/FixJ family response regulator
MENINTKIRLAIVDDEALIVMLLTDYLTKLEKYEVVLTATDGSQIVEMLRETKVLPEIILLDLQMKNMDGIETTTILKKEFPDLKIIVVSSHYKKSFMGYMLKLGVCAFLPKGIAPSKLAEAVDEVHVRGYYFMDEQIDVMRKQISTSVPVPALSPVEELFSEREIDILRLICQQYTAPQISEKLFITKRTVEGHKSNLLLKTSTRNTAGLVVYAIQNKIIDIDECFMPH